GAPFPRKRNYRNGGRCRFVLKRLLPSRLPKPVVFRFALQNAEHCIPGLLVMTWFPSRVGDCRRTVASVQRLAGSEAGFAIHCVANDRGLVAAKGARSYSGLG